MILLQGIGKAYSFALIKTQTELLNTFFPSKNSHHQKSIDFIIISAFFLDFITSSALSLSLFSTCIIKPSVLISQPITRIIRDP